MPDQIRRANAKAAASKYAPKPDGSAITYGLIAVSVLAVALIFYGVFYSVDMLSQPVALFLAVIASFITGVGVRLWMKRRHRAAYEAEYALRQPGDPNAG